MSTNIEMGKRLAKCRKEVFQMNPARFAAALEITPQYLGKLENGQRTIQPEIINVLYLSKGISMNYLLKGEEPILVEETLRERLQIHLGNPQQSVVINQNGHIHITTSPSNEFTEFLAMILDGQYIDSKTLLVTIRTLFRLVSIFKENPQASKIAKNLFTGL